MVFLPATDWVKVRAASDYREFLKEYLEARSLNHSDLARTAGFGRSFASDVISGRRKLTSKSCYAFEKALKLPLPGRRLFRLLVARDVPGAIPELDSVQVSKGIQDLRSRSWEPVRKTLEKRELKGAAALLASPDAIAVFASAGEPGKAVTFQKLKERTRLDDRALEEALKVLESSGLVKYSEGQYEPSDLHVFLKVTDQDQLVAQLFRLAVARASQRVDSAMGSSQELFFTSSFCVQESRLPELKAALRATVLRFVDESIQSDGDRVAHLVTGFHL